MDKITLVERAVEETYRCGDVVLFRSGHTVENGFVWEECFISVDNYAMKRVSSRMFDAVLYGCVDMDLTRFLALSDEFGE